jgi:hypothetical protein
MAVELFAVLDLPSSILDPRSSILDPRSSSPSFPVPVKILDIPFRRHRKGPSGGRTPAALTLVAALIYPVGPRIRLQFDRAIDVGGRDGSQIIVDAGDITSLVYVATGSATLLDPATVEIELVETGPTEGVQMLLTASATNRIVATDDGGTWAGCTDLVLPFP